MRLAGLVDQNGVLVLAAYGLNDAAALASLHTAWPTYATWCKSGDVERAWQHILNGSGSFQLSYCNLEPETGFARARTVERMAREVISKTKQHRG